jgi:hypothetical protein
MTAGRMLRDLRSLGREILFRPFPSLGTLTTSTSFPASEGMKFVLGCMTSFHERPRPRTPQAVSQFVFSSVYAIDMQGMSTFHTLDLEETTMPWALGRWHSDEKVQQNCPHQYSPHPSPEHLPPLPPKRG